MFMKNLSEEFFKTHSKITIPESLFDEILEIQPVPLLKKRPPHMCFHTNFTRSLRTAFS